MRISFAGSGEDLVVFDLLKNISSSQRGIYVDAGAFDPILMSNTHLLYKNGWRGVNIDASPDAIEKFRTVRPDDINICSGLSDQSGHFIYVEYAGGTGNRLLASADGGTEKSLCGDTPLRKTMIQTKRLSDLLREHIEGRCAIDFLSIDCEGFDLQVLQGLELDFHRPKVICFEAEWMEESAIYRYLDQNGYRLKARSLSNAIFVDSKSGL
jgi:FkbM family methyltransferase